MRRSLIRTLAVVAVAATGCGGDERRTERPAAAASPVAASGPTEAEIRGFTCGQFELGLTNTDGAFVVSAISRAAGVDMHTAGKTVEQICRRAEPRVKPYAKAVRRLGGEKE